MWQDIRPFGVASDNFLVEWKFFYSIFELAYHLHQKNSPFKTNKGSLSLGDL